ncbi:hypothetical protein PCE1_003495 [Barthelona sp. PCE]
MNSNSSSTSSQSSLSEENQILFRNPLEKSLNILMVSCFCSPNVGGVETHMHCISEAMALKGHSVTILTHKYGERRGVRYLCNGVKVYYLPTSVVKNSAAMLTFLASYPYFWSIINRESIDIIHYHQLLSATGIEAVTYGSIMGIPTVLTNHSLMDMTSMDCLYANAALKGVSCCLDHIIGVSMATKESMVLGGRIDPSKVSVIPNAVQSQNFTPATKPKGRIVISVVSRLVYRKGIDLLAYSIPEICNRHDNVDFVIAGDGPKMALLQQIIEDHGLHDRVNLLGVIPHSQVRDVVSQSHIFFNTSLTDAFNISIVEAALCGCLVVSSNVGAIPSVLPPDIMTTADPVVSDLVEAACVAIERAPSVDPFKQHERAKNFYCWFDVGDRVLNVYDTLLKSERLTLVDRLKYSYSCGPYYGKFLCLILLTNFFVQMIWRMFKPAHKIEKAIKVYNNDLKEKDEEKDM